jgi:hypothetical protein
VELINRVNKTYGPGSKLKAHEPEVNIAVSYGPSPWVQQHQCRVRGVLVDKLAIREGDDHVWCLFPDGRVMIVAERNIRASKFKRINHVSTIF